MAFVPFPISIWRMKSDTHTHTQQSPVEEWSMTTVAATTTYHSDTDRGTMDCEHDFILISFDDVVFVRCVLLVVLQYFAASRPLFFHQLGSAMTRLIGTALHPFSISLTLSVQSFFSLTFIVTRDHPNG